MIGIKNFLGNVNNDIAFIGTLLIRKFLDQRFSVIDFDAGAKAQGAPGIDIEVKTANGQVIIGELKTTKPYQPGFGAAQKANIRKDLLRLAATPADFRFMFVTDEDAFSALMSDRYRREVQSVEVIKLLDFDK